jgi:hypothetical protein
MFHRLWQQLHVEPRSLPYSWIQEDGRWCCRLRPLAADQRRQLESERVADSPEIELRILVQPGRSPTLAEVVFPPSMSIGQAKRYIFHELAELPIQALGHAYRWREEDDRLVVQLSDLPATAAVPVSLAEGVHETVCLAHPEGNGESRWSATAPTCCLEFDRRLGWDRTKAQEWLRRHLGIRDLGRTVQLDVPYRMDPKLALLLSGMYPPPSYCVTQLRTAAGMGAAPPVQLVAVENDRSEPRRRGPLDGRDGRVPVSARPHAARGAGLELDLADPRHRERLPGPLRNSLPERGLVNYSEAQIMVSFLEGLVRSNGADNPLDGGIAVTALYPAQVALIRSLVDQSPLLASRKQSIQIGDPAAFRQREFAIVLVGLTRSHYHRAVSYGEGPEQLLLTMTRARRRLIVFGDPGTLARRAEWDDVVDHLDETAAARERYLAQQLLRWLPGDPGPPQARNRREGKCS